MKLLIKLSGLFFSTAPAIFLLGLTTFSLSDSKIQQLIATSNLYNLRFPQEKIYLHLDRSSYWANDDIWFKAYVKDSPVNECNLYVELINSSGVVIYKRILWVQNGLAYGDIHLEKTLPGGMYQIRAYTNWMRNFNDVWFFRKDLVIWNPADKIISAGDNRLKDHEIDLQLFPESGTLISDIENKIAFKATDKNGKGIDFTGLVTDNSGNLVCEIQTTYKGMGCFFLVPHTDKNYKIKATFAENTTKSVNLPKPVKEGTALRVNSIETSRIKIQVINTFANSNTEYLVIGQSRGQVCYQKKVIATSEITHLEIEKKSLPGGIVRFTLFNSSLYPVCERLVFNNHLNLVNLVVSPEKNDYLPRGKVEIKVGAITHGYPHLTNLSMSVYNRSNQLREEEYPNNIYTQFLINSELKGNIENPAYYFKDDSLSTLMALDNLMLTHGYRQFEWKTVMDDEFPEITYQPEPSTELRGKVISTVLGKPVANAKVTMMTLKSLLGVYEDKTDSLGQFVFSDLFYYDTIYVSLRALNPRGKKTTLIEIDNRSATSPEVNHLPLLYDYENEAAVQTLAQLSEKKSDLIKNKWKLSDTILIPEVDVVARINRKDDGHFRMYLNADYVFDMKNYDDLTGNIFESIEGKIPGVIYDLSTGSFYARGEKLQIYLNGMIITEDNMANLPSQMFDKVEYVKSGLFAGINYSGGILFFYTKRGKKNIKTPIMAAGMESARIIGYSVSRKFYSPIYGQTTLPEKNGDNRPTLYWNPLVRTDSTGNALVEFYNSDETGIMKIVVEGISSDGKLCRGESRYKVEY